MIGPALLVPAMDQHYRPARAAATPLMLDQMSVPALCAISLARKLRAGYMGPAYRVRRSDTLEQDIGFAGDLVDTLALLAFVGAGTGTVVRGYDQGLFGCDLWQTNIAKQPIVVSAGALVITTGAGAAGKPTMNLTAGRSLERPDACGLTGAPALTMAGRFRYASGAGIPIMLRVGAAGFASIATKLFGLAVNDAVAGQMSITVDTHGPRLNLTHAFTDSAYYVARAAAGAGNGTFRLRSYGVDRAFVAQAG